MNIIKYLKGLLYMVVIIITFSMLIAIFNYFNWMSNGILKYFKVFIPIVAMLVGGIYVGRRSNKKGYLEGLKIGGIWIILLIILNYLGFDKGFSIRSLIFYAILLISTMLGSMIGINHKKMD